MAQGFLKALREEYVYGQQGTSVAEVFGAQDLALGRVGESELVERLVDLLVYDIKLSRCSTDELRVLQDCQYQKHGPTAAATKPPLTHVITSYL